MEEVMLQWLSEPSFWSTTVLLVCLVPTILGMLFGTPKRRSVEAVWLYRGAGIEVLFVLLPFVLYAVGNSLNGSFAKFMASPELPMAAMVLFAMTLFSMFKGIYASQGRVAIEAFLVGLVISIFLVTTCGVYVFWLAFKQDVWLWFGPINAVLIVLAAMFSFAITASMAYLGRFPEHFGAEADTQS